MIEDTKDALRLSRRYRDDNLYVILTFDEEGSPYAIQLSISGEKINHDERTLSNIDTIARFVTLSLREYDLEYVIGNLMQVSRGPRDLACILAEILMEYGEKYVQKNV